MMTEPKRIWRWGVFRWIVLAILILGFFGTKAFAPVQPHIQLPAEAISQEPLFTSKILGDFYITNTMVAMVIVDVLLIAAAWAVRCATRKAMKRGDYVPRGFYGVLEAILEMIYNLTEQTAGAKWARKIFPWFATITLMVLVANWMELIPGVDSIGILHPSEHGFATAQLLPGIVTLVKGELGAGQQGYNLVPFVRVLSTDLNFTIALALISVIATQVIGLRAQGLNYLTKFWNTKTLFKKPMFGVIDWGVGILELISEFSKILSFSFRLFGNIFAGSVMLFVIGSLIPVFAQSIFVGLEFFVGLIQAVVFGMLTMIFMASATQGHGEAAEEHAGK